jgi:putative ABC transport system permease protein
MNLLNREWKIAYRNLLRNKRRSLAFCIAMTFTVCGLTLLGGYIERNESLMRTISVYLAQNGHLSIYQKDGADKFSLSPKKYQIKNEDLVKIKEILDRPVFQNRIDYYGEFLQGMGLISRQSSSTPFLATGINPEIIKKIYDNEDVKNWISTLDLNLQKNNLDEAIKSDPNSLSITKNMGELIGLKTPVNANAPEMLEVQLSSRNVFGDLNAINARVAVNHTTGIALAEDTSLLLPINVLQELMALDGIGHLSLFLKNSTDLFFLQSELSNAFEKAGLKIDVLPFFDARVSEMYIGTMGFMMVMACFFIFMIYSAGILSLTNVVSMNILERTKEIGTMRSLGFNQKGIARIFMKETIIISFISILLGNVLIYFISFFINSLNIRILPPYIPGSMKFVLFSNLSIKLCVALPLIFISSVTSYYIAYNKTKKNIAHLLNDIVR